MSKKPRLVPESEGVTFDIFQAWYVIKKSRNKDTFPSKIILID